MIVFTMVDYWRYQSKIPIRSTVHDTEEKYKLEKERKNTHQYHDKIFKEILDNKKEFIMFIKKYIRCEQKENLIKESDIEKYNREFITSDFTVKESDIIYRMKEKDVFFIVEHQSRIDYEMAKRINEYCVELIRNVTKGEKNPKVYPLIIPIVLYTGKKRWNAPRSLSEMQEKYDGFEPLNYPKYNLVDINILSKDELIEEKSGISKAILFEKIETKEETKRAIDKLIEIGLTEEEKRYLKMILTYSNDIRKKLDIDEINNYKKIISKGDDSMTNFERLFIELLDEKHEKQRKAKEEAIKEGKEQGLKEGKEEGIKEGRKEGRKEGIREGMKIITKEMLRKQFSDEIIMDTTKINKKDLQKLKEELKVC